MERIIAVVVLAIILVLLTGFSVIYVSKQAPKAILGGIAPDFTLRSVAGKKVSLSDFHGQLLVINFFTTWCRPCIKAEPELQRFQEKYGDQVKLIMIARAEPVLPVKQFIRKFGATSLFVLDRNNRVTRLYGVAGQPETFFIDEKGAIRDHKMGPLTEKNLVELVNKFGEEQLK